MTVATFAACYADWKLIKTRKTVQIILEVPVEKSNEAYAALNGMPNAGEEIWVAVARLDPTKIKSGASASGRDEDGQLGRSASSRPHKPVAAERRLTQRAGILCADPLFHKWLGQISKMENVTEEEATVYVRNKCGVASRKEIVPGTDAARLFDEHIDGPYSVWLHADEFVDAAE